MTNAEQTQQGGGIGALEQTIKEMRKEPTQERPNGNAQFAAVFQGALDILKANMHDRPPIKKK